MIQGSRTLKNKSNFELIVAVGFLSFVIVTGCASSGLTIKQLDSVSKLSENPKDSIVFGVIEVKGFEGIGNVVRSFEIIEFPSLRKSEVTFSNGEPFYLVLDPGEYQICGVYRYKLLDFLMGLRFGPANPNVDMRFTAKESEALYIGNLVLTVRPSWYDIRLLDEYEQMRNRLQQKFPELRQSVQKKLMH